VALKSCDSNIRSFEDRECVPTRVEIGSTLGDAPLCRTPSRVPRLTLLESLQEVLNLYSTTDLGENDLYLEVAADLTSAEPFKVIAPAALAPRGGDLCPPFDGQATAHSFDASDTQEN
jgi:hypothetical protein